MVHPDADGIGVTPRRRRPLQKKFTLQLRHFGNRKILKLHQLVCFKPAEGLQIGFAGDDKLRGDGSFGHIPCFYNPMYGQKPIIFAAQDQIGGAAL